MLIFQKQGVQGFKILYWLSSFDDKDKDMDMVDMDMMDMDKVFRSIFKESPV